MKHFQAPFYNQITKLVLPIVLQSLLSSAVNSVDVVMLGFVGQSSISAVSLASQYAHMLFIVFNGLGTGATILCAQYYGRKNYRAIEILQAIALRVSLAISLAFALCAAAIPGPMMRLFTADSELIALGADYIRILSVCYLCWGVTEVYIAILRSTGRAAAGMALNAIAVGVNILLNAVFIFGWLGAPKMGVIGVALATTISRLIELALCFAVSARSGQVKLRPSRLLENNKLLSRDFARLSLPAMANAAVFGLAFSTFTAVIGHLGSAAVSNLLIAGMFRAGGDSRFGLICDIFVMWGYAVPLALLSAFVFKLPVLWVYFLFCTDEFAKWPWIIRRYRSGKWIKIVAREDLFEDG